MSVAARLKALGDQNKITGNLLKEAQQFLEEFIDKAVQDRKVDRSLLDELAEWVHDQHQRLNL